MATQNTNVEPIPIEVPTGRNGMWWFLGSEIPTFGAILAVYTLFRVSHPEWGQHAAHTLTWAGTLNTVILLTSSLFVVLAHKAATDKDHKASARWLLLTLLLGLCFLGVKGYEYSHEIHEGLTPVTNTFWSFYFFMTGLHGLHVLAGLVAMVVIWFQVSKGQNLHRVEVIGIYWHFVDVVWIFLFPLLYLAS